jgi:hypothetical protein
MQIFSLAGEWSAEAENSFASRVPLTISPIDYGAVGNGRVMRCISLRRNREFPQPNNGWGIPATSPQPAWAAGIKAAASANSAINFTPLGNRPAAARADLCELAIEISFDSSF